MGNSRIEQYLRENDELIYSQGQGTSMLPLIRQGRDKIILRKKEEGRFRKYDVVLYEKPEGRFVMHRIIKAREKDYVLLGDNCIRKEYGITDGDIIGVMTGFVRNGRTHSVEELGYMLYSRIWCAIAPIRIFTKKLNKKLKYIVRKLLK